MKSHTLAFISLLALVAPQAAYANASFNGNINFKPGSVVDFQSQSVDFSNTTVTGLDSGAPCAKNVNGPCKVDTSTTKTVDRSTTNNTTNNYYGSDAMPPELRTFSTLPVDEGAELETAEASPASTTDAPSQSASFNSGGNNSTNNTTNTLLSLPETAVAPLPMGDNIGTIGDVSVPLPAVSVGGFASRKPYEIDGYSTSGDYDYGVSAGFSIPLGTNKFHKAAQQAMRLQQLQILKLERELGL